MDSERWAPLATDLPFPSGMGSIALIDEGRDPLFFLGKLTLDLVQNTRPAAAAATANDAIDRNAAPVATLL